MKIGHFLYWDFTGGGTNSMISQIRYLHDKGYEQIVYYGGMGKLAEVCEELHIEHRQVPTDSMLKSLWGWIPLSSLLRQNRLDILILHGQWAGPIGTIAGIFARVPRLWYVARWPSFYTDWDLFRTVRNYLCEWLPCSRADQVIVLSQSNRYQYVFRKLVASEKIKVIPNGFNLNLLPSESNREEIRKKFGWEDACTHIVAVTRLEVQKQVDWLLRSWKLVSREVGNAKLWIVGGGREEESLRKLCRELKLERCEFLGSQPKGISFIHASDLTVMTSMYESFGRVIVEAMVCGKAFVANEDDGFRDIAQDGVQGYLVPVGDTKAFADRMIELIRDPTKREEMGKRGRERAIDFDEKKVHAQLEALIEQNS